MNPEKATDYLSRVNWKSLVEWLTAEAILNRPANPIQFCRDILGEKLADQTSADFKPDNITEWLRSCYTEATALVDEHGIIQGKTLEAAQQSLPEQITELRRKVDGMQQLLDASSTIATLDPHQATDNIVAETCRILNCDRATIFTVDNITKELVLSVAEGAKNIRVPIGQVNIMLSLFRLDFLIRPLIRVLLALWRPLARRSTSWMLMLPPDSAPGMPSLLRTYTFHGVFVLNTLFLFASLTSADKASGYRTVNILCMPIKSVDGSIVGVLQAINKKDGSFTPTDEDVMSLLATQAGIALQNANLYRNSESARDKFRSLLDIIRAMQGEMGVNSLIFTITQRTIRVVDADRCTLYLVDNVHRGLFAMQGEVRTSFLTFSPLIIVSFWLAILHFHSYDKHIFNR